MTMTQSNDVPLAERPNVVLICADQWRADALSVAGHPDVRTPALDGLARSGVRCERAYSATPTCVPARVSMMTGLKPSTHGRVGYEDGVEFNIETTLPGCFQAAGYHTQAIGKMHYWPERGRIGFDDVILHDGYLHYSRRRCRPVEEYDDYLPWLREQVGQSSYADYLDNGLGCNSMVARPWDKDERVHPTTWVVTQAERWLYRRDPTVPFFLYLSFHRPHAPLDPPTWAFERYARRRLREPVRGDWTQILDPYRRDSDVEAHVADYPDDQVQEALAGYYGSISHVDQQIGRLLQILGEFGLSDNTIVAFISDHGDMMGDHGMWRKGYAYEGSSRVPLLLAGPSIEPGQVRNELIELRDLMPTLLEAAGVEVPTYLEGHSLVPRLAPSDVPWREYLHGEHVIFGQSMQWIVTQRYKYVWWSETGQEQLFDLLEDPAECHDLASDPAQDEALTRCRHLLVAELAGREEGFVAEGRLVKGRKVKPTLECSRIPRR